MQLGFIHQGDLGSRVIGRRDQHIFFVRAQIINNLGFVSWMCSLAAIHPRCYFRRAARDQCEHGPASAPIKLYLRALKLGFHRMITSETFFLKMRFVQPIENVRVFLVQGPSKPVSHCMLTSDKDQAFLRVVSCRWELFWVFFGAPYNLTKIPGLFIDPKCKHASYYASKTVGNECKKKKKNQIQTLGKISSCLMLSIYSRIYTAFDVHIAYGLGMFCCIYSKREASIYHRWWYYLWWSLTLILRVPIISIHVNKREQHSCSLWWFFPLKK